MIRQLSAIRRKVGFDGGEDLGDNSPTRRGFWI